MGFELLKTFYLVILPINLVVSRTTIESKELRRISQTFGQYLSAVVLYVMFDKAL